jgi:hypothetical protein
VTTAHIYRPVRGAVAALGIGFDDFVCLLPGDDVRRVADAELAHRGWRRTAPWTEDTPHNPRTGLWTAPVDTEVRRG